MDTRQMYMSRISTLREVDLFVRIFVLLERIITFPTIRDDRRILLNILAYKRDQAISIHIRYPLHPNSSKSFWFMNFNSNHYYRFSSCSSSSLTTFISTTDESLINFNIPGERISARPDHGSAHFVEPTPSCLITLQAEDSFKSKGATTKFLTCDIPNCLKPEPKRLSGSLKNCSGKNRRFMLTCCASKKARFHLPCFASVAHWTNKTIRPTKFLQIIKAGLLCCKPFVKFLQCFWVINSGNWVGSTIIHDPL